MKRVLIATLLASAVFATDFSQMSTDALVKMRGTVSPSERTAFQTEMQKRMQTMTPAQRQQLMQTAPGQGKGMAGQNSQGMKSGQGKGRGMGAGQGQGMGKGMKCGQGKCGGGMAGKNGKGMGMQNRPAFGTYDANGDGKISPKEFADAQAKHMTQRASEGKMMKNAGNAPKFENVDTNHDGAIDTTEFQHHQQMQQRKNR